MRRYFAVSAFLVGLVGCGSSKNSEAVIPTADQDASVKDGSTTTDGTVADGAAPDSAVADNAPKVFWVSQPVNHDETILITGGNLTSGTTTQLAQLSDEDPGPPGTNGPSVSVWTDLTPAAPSNGRSVTATVPASWTDGAYALRLKNGDTSGSIQLVNVPDPWFVQGDMGDSATPGGYLYVAGTTLERTGGVGPRAVLVQKGTSTVVASMGDPERVTVSTGYGLKYAVPASTPEGDYELWLHNGRGGKAGWVKFSTFVEAAIDTVKVKNPEVWPSTVINVSKQAGASDDERFANAIVAANDGGRIYVPTGTYALTKQLALPDHVVLYGDGKDKTLIQWTADPGVVGDNGRSALVRGKNLVEYPRKNATFALENLSLEASLGFRGNVVERSTTEGRSWIKGVRIAAAGPWKLVPKQDGTGEEPAPWPVAIYVLQAKNTILDDMVLDAGEGIKAYYGVQYLRVTNSTIHWRQSNVAVQGGRSQNFVMIGNTLNQRGTAASNGWTYYTSPDPGMNYASFGPRYWGGPYTRDMLWSGNHSTRDDNSELPRQDVGYTSDGVDGIYFGKISAVNGSTLSLAGTTQLTVCTAWSDSKQTTCASTATLDYNSTNAAGMVAQIVDGKGAGQWRFVTYTQPGANTITIDRPWDLEPDSSSTLAINTLQGRLLQIDNDYALEPKNQDFYITLDIVKAGNKFGAEPESAIMVTWVGTHYSCLAPAWHMQALGNQSSTKMVYETMLLNSARVPASDTYGLAPFDGQSVSGHVFRNNQQLTTKTATLFLASGPTTIPDSGYSKGPLSDILVEHNQLDTIVLNPGNAGGTIPASDVRLSGVLLRNNKLSSGTATKIQPAENIGGVTAVQ